ncbi:hypothetical protein B1759_15890 [Rubrivirga sp. SAORIC476]|jgi:hypothetical protein|uniref:DUF305 domain-containing protein n=1 Tax=Rubrivirga sp. SAORIC476 TaxID=1961794 RepID=UPI000BA96084|nr:DUF305 domain-containing protein [Rubrivirga sp. SAORIC476]MAQ94550.1 DUF305 domain-containing protein [Rhodothermaceae bacterium]MBC14512.1 DUF305 domain-containing protein [Rhodothermaceae bacterium]PAP78918.1 hypothetical protein B1759_15890 [Rubrivirga sp. SAORIC476]
MSYGRFFAMIAASTVAMFILMYSTVFSTDHIWWSSTKTLMAVYMGATMAVIMLAFMLKMYDDKRKNVAIFVGSAVVFALAFFLFRGQTTVGDVTWMKQMIPHHSLAILTSERANISDPRVRRLADEIILAQRREIAEMEALIGDLEDSDYESPDLPPTVPEVEGGSEDIPEAPVLTVGASPFRGDVLVLDEVTVESDAWVVVHPEAPGGGPDATQVLGRSFVMHGTSERVPVDLDAPPTGTLYVMLHDDTGEIGRFEFGGAGTPDQPLTSGGAPVVVEVSVR